jgi:predicted nucleic acid-binding protein
VNVAEVYSGVRPGEELRLHEFLSALDCYPVTIEIGRRAGRLRNEWASMGRTLSLPDTIVAATALPHDLALMTDNRKDFPRPELKFHG